MQGSHYKIEKSEVLRYLGYAGQEISAETQAKIDALSELCLEVSRPAFQYRIFPVSLSENAVEVGSGAALFEGHDISEHLRGAESCAVMAATLGMEFERRAHLLETGSIGDALIFSAAGTALIESVADVCEGEIRASAERDGYYVNFRYSPGYGDFPIETQKTLLRLVDAERRLGITLTDGLMMIPRKSVSAVLGIFGSLPNDGERGCEVCEMRDKCEIRKAGKGCGK